MTDSNANSPLHNFLDGETVICPACGGSVGCKHPRSFILRPNNRMRGHLNGLLIELRNFTRGMDAFLANRTNELQLHSIYSTPYFREEALYLVDRKLLDADQYARLQLVDDEGNLKDEVKQQLMEGKTLQAIAEEAQNGSQPVAELLNKVFSANGEFQAWRGDSQWTVPSSQVWAHFFQMQIDTHDFAANFARIPNPRPGADDVTTEQAQIYVKTLLGIGLERRANGLLLDLACEQPAIGHFLQSGALDSHQELICNIVRKVCPSLASHFDLLKQVCDADDNAAENEGASLRIPEPGVREQIRQNLKRAWLLLLILHGHAFCALEDAERQEIIDDPKMGDSFRELFLTNLYVFDEKTQVSTQLLTRMMNSRSLLQTMNEAFHRLLPRFLRQILDRFVATGKRKPEPWLQKLDTLCSVFCNCDVLTNVEMAAAEGETGQPGGWLNPLRKLASFLERRKRNIVVTATSSSAGDPPAQPELEERRLFLPCDYPLTAEPTFSVVILGSMGAGKTCAYHSAITRLWKLSESLRVDLTPVDAESLLRMERIRDDVRNGRLSDPTENNFTVNLAAAELPDGKAKIRISLLDIPGETVFSLISGTGADSELRRIMKSANAVVFLYDLWCDTVFLQDIQRSSDKFQVGLQQSRETEESRKDKQGSQVDQRILLHRLCHLLEEELGNEEMRKIPFICVLPKADLLIDQNALSEREPGRSENEQLILTRMMQQLVEAGLLVNDGRSSSTGEAGTAGPAWQSFAAVEPNLQKFRELLREYEVLDDSQFRDRLSDLTQLSTFEFQIVVAELLSKMTLKALQEMEKMLPPETSTAWQQSFKGRMLEGVVGKLQSRFDECYFLPTSALGGPTTSGDGNRPTIDQIHPMFVEYTFLTPLMIALNKYLPGQRQSANQERNNQESN